MDSMINVAKAQRLLDKAPDVSKQDLPALAIELASCILEEANKVLAPKEIKRQKQLQHLVEEKTDKVFALMMTDQCFRCENDRRIADQLSYLINRLGYPKFLPSYQKWGLKFMNIARGAFSSLMIPFMQNMIRRDMSDIILPGEEDRLWVRLQDYLDSNIRVNFNYLGEAVLGEKEAKSRLEYYLNILRKPEIEYVSVKISSIYSQINLLAWKGTVEILSQKLSQLYKIAQQNVFVDSKGHERPKFVNLDMEEVRDLDLTIEVFKKVLSDPEFFYYQAGIVLQAYLPQSYELQKLLTEWSLKRVSRGGAPIKIRIVKGANLGMESIESSLKGWPQAPFLDKTSVDAQFKKMIEYALEEDRLNGVHIGIASHNLFDISYAIVLIKHLKIVNGVSFEMLEGMAPHLRRVIHKITGDMLLYCPAACEQDFTTAMAYLFRRLDESTSPQNFLRHSFFLKEGSSAWDYQKDSFLRSFTMMSSLSHLPRRTQNRIKDSIPLERESFKNELDTDFSLHPNRFWAREIIEEWKLKKVDPLPLVIDGEEFFKLQSPGLGVDPSKPDSMLYYYSTASIEDVEQALICAKNTETTWQSTSINERVELMHRIAHLMRKRRGDLIGAMVVDGGKIVTEADAEVSEAIDFACYYASCLEKWGTLPELELKPKGTVVVLSPWNFPVAILAGGILSALASGNCVIAKPSRETVLCGYELLKLFWEAGVSKKVLQMITGDENVFGDFLVGDGRVNAVILTGASETARRFIEKHESINLYAETGGKNAIVVTEMADRDQSVKDIISSAFSHSGQKCSAASLLICTPEVYEDERFKQQLKDAVSSLEVGPAWKFKTKISPLISPPGDSLIRGMTVLEGREHWLLEPKQHPDNPHLWSPGIKWGVESGSFSYQNELFGPVLSVMRARDFDHAIALVNHTPYGLTSGLQSLDPREQALWIQEIKAGNYYINRGITGAIVERQPFGGCKESCFGEGKKAGGPHYLLQFCDWHQHFIPDVDVELPTCYQFLSSLDIFQKLSESEKKIFALSLKQYVYWNQEYFRKKHDPQMVLGQDNWFFHKPYERIIYRVQSEDSMLDMLRLIALAQVCKFHLEISDKEGVFSSMLGAKLKKRLKFFYVHESDENFIQRISHYEYPRVRFLSSCSSSLRYLLRKVANICDRPLLGLGRLELLHYFREVSISYDYHRYGNLGGREGEERKPST